MESEKRPRELEVVEIKITQPIKMEWICPRCGKTNEEIFYAPVRKTRVQCDYCGQLFMAER